MYETLLQETHEEEIEVVYTPLRGTLQGIYNNQIIAINKNIVCTTEKACILAEELGHYHTTAGNILDQTKLQNRKQERKARSWSYQRLVPLDKLIQASKAGIRTRHDLAEYLNITEHFLAATLLHYKEKHGLYCRVGEYYLYFEPLGVLQNIEME